ncbi:TatD family hydrolase [Halopseudomonas yangmingensis]|uniref:TatD DNase family protein n=1 Tax=Halopseudomonas yangmingensis TaxID=1720063 RepID=A0A1I4P410_9GAMM|nr:TatD family hydrolase [Halopseudomonas yangmingensis]SFM22532.1 TatD DNase family protein [Halopseudomonas yangmingensis]
MRFVDSHTHLDFPAFARDRQAVLAACVAGGVERILLMGVSRNNWDSIRQLARTSTSPRLYAAFGMHPLFLEQHQPEDLHALRALLDDCRGDPSCVGIGEIGLDYFVETLDRQRQQQLFEAQLQLTAEYRLPVILHVRRAHAATIATLKRFRLPRGGVVHAFSGSLEEAREYQRLGFMLGIGGAFTWPRAIRLQRVIKALPATQLLLETDAPDMAPAFQADERNSPHYLPEIARQMALLRNEPLEQLAEQCWANSCQLFDWQA